MLTDWLKVEVTTYPDTGEETLSFSHTPEEFVNELKRRRERIVVTKSSCSECFFVPDGPLSKEVVQTSEILALHRIPECIGATVARFLSMPDIPGFVVCYGFYYQHWHDNKYLLAAKNADLVTFYDTAKLPTLRESGLKIHKPYLV